MKKICFLVGSMDISGGTYVIVQHASYLKEQGYDIVMAVQSPFNEDTLKWHDKASLLNCLAFDEAKSLEFDLVVATWWKTAIHLHEFTAQHYGYFVQSIESKFYSKGQDLLVNYVDSTYKLPVNMVTEASWIKQHLEQKFGQHAALVKNGIRKDIYHASNEDDRTGFRVLVEGHFGVPFKNTALAVKLAKEANVEDIWVLTGSPIKWLPGVSKVYSQIPMSETAEIYRKCDVILKLSTVEGMFGPPLEMFHCGGTAIVFDVSGHDEYIVDDYNACVVKNKSIDDVRRLILELKANPDKLNRLKQGALTTASNWPDWDIASQHFTNWVERVLEQPVNNSVQSDIKSLNERHDKDFRNSDGQSFKSPSLVLFVKRVLHHMPRPIKSAFKYIEAILEVLSKKRVVR
ncbi:glycosyltransferase involved in cell wall biosynthesis [Vibrio diazotrophicus]|uniref:Glycosyltransferase involved in cell wall biosynthesis n=2 Tax=Vibrio diazotrophicus TaxID=685 RepID=A0A329DWD8_VIBDI|nr:glycosyltransferase involved in cell wall biosynthesis [Vibrio diazotrophicus]